MKHKLAHAQRWLAKRKSKAMLYPLESWERAAIAKLPLDERIEQLREAIAALDKWKKGHTMRIGLEKDVFRAARGVLLPLRKVNPLSEPTTAVPLDEASKLAVAIRAGRVVYTDIASFECASSAQAQAAIQAINSHSEQSTIARFATEADIQKILKDGVSNAEPANPWEQQPK